MNGRRTRDSVSPQPAARPHPAGQTNHYDVWLLPSLVPLVSPASFFVVNAAAGLETGLGIRYGLAANGAPVRDAGFFLPRDPAYSAQRAVQLGWVEENTLALLESIVDGTPFPLAGAGSEDYCKEWILAVAARLEMEGVLANPEIIIKHAL